MESDLFAVRQCAQVLVEPRVIRLADNLQVHANRDCVHQVIDSLVWKQAAHEDHTSIARPGTIGAELLRVHAAQNDVCPRLSGVTESFAAVLADMEMAVVLSIRGDVGGHIPAASAQIADEYPASSQPAGKCSKAAGQDVLLMTVDDPGLRQFPK